VNAPHGAFTQTRGRKPGAGVVAQKIILRGWQLQQAGVGVAAIVHCSEIGSARLPPWVIFDDFGEADRGYDADWIRELAMKKGAWANIPPKSNRSDPHQLQPLSLPRSQPGRAVLQQDQTMSSGGDALRQARRELSCLRSTCVDQAVAAR
jgi:hypothetical protein